MPKPNQRYPMVDNVASLSFLIGWDGTVAGHTYRVIVPLETLTLDGGAAPALLATIDDLKLFGPAGVDIFLSGADVAPAGGALAQAVAPIDPRQDVRYTLQFFIRFEAGVATAASQLLALFGHTEAQDGPVEADITWPAVAATVTPPITVATSGGAAIGAKVDLVTW